MSPKQLASHMACHTLPSPSPNPQAEVNTSPSYLPCFSTCLQRGSPEPSPLTVLPTNLVSPFFDIFIFNWHGNCMYLHGITVTIQYIYIYTLCDGQTRVTAISVTSGKMGTHKAGFTSCSRTLNESLPPQLSHGGVQHESCSNRASFLSLTHVKVVLPGPLHFLAIHSEVSSLFRKVGSFLSSKSSRKVFPGQ